MLSFISGENKSDYNIKKEFISSIDGNINSRECTECSFCEYSYNCTKSKFLLFSKNIDNYNFINLKNFIIKNKISNKDLYLIILDINFRELKDYKLSPYVKKWRLKLENKILNLTIRYQFNTMIYEYKSNNIFDILRFLINYYYFCEQLILQLKVTPNLLPFK